MISIARFWISVSLMLLQLAAPLIHAHKNENFGTSFHLPEFENIEKLLEKSTMYFAPVTQGDQIVTLSAGMKNNKRRILLGNDFRLFIMSPLLILSWLQNSIINCFVKIESIKLFCFSNFNAPPRAPPSVLFC